ncbi:MAG: calcium/sodium antiporter [Bdellovibrionaceae bacterium]|nr:calcium/sodium antiporter [Pseudobdellovibrionaceae bacterium]
MEFIFPLLMIIFGFAILLVGGELLVKGSVSLAVRLKISPAIIGLTIIAAGTSAPELVTSILAAIKNAPDMAMGNVIGSNIFNILGILGVASIIKPNRVDSSFMKVEIPMLIICTILLLILSWDMQIESFEGLLCLIVLAILFYISIYRAKKVGYEAEEEIEVLRTPFHDIGFLLIGCFALLGGAHISLENGIELGRLAGLSERIIGITIISVGTGLPEFATTVIAAYKGQNDIAVGNIIGSNLINTMGVVGGASLFKGLTVSEEIARFDNLILLGVTIFFFVVLLVSKARITRPMGLIFSLAYVAYILMLIYK